MINIILCGGSGTRLWPLSRTMLPKQFVRLFDSKSLFQDTVLRNAPLCSQSMIVSNRDQYFLAVDQLDQIESHSNQFLLEPVGRKPPLPSLWHVWLSTVMTWCLSLPLTIW
jgi:mannose-1-phosphate guanylyltransferase